MNIGIIGLGHLGEIHLKQWKEIVSIDLIYCFDYDSEKLESLCDIHGVKPVSSFDELLENCELIDIVTPTTFHFEYAVLALKANKHVFIEKPVCETSEQVLELIELQKKSNTLVQIGHVERYNEAYQTVEGNIINPRFFEVHRLAPFVSRGTEVSVIMDLMIHDLDIILHLVDSPIKNIYANGVKILSKSPDIANVRLEFENGCIANLTASRISMKKMRKMRVFSDSGYISIDFLEKKSEIFEITDSNNSKEGISFINFDGEEKKLEVKEYKKLDKNAIHDELSDFYQKIIYNKKDTRVNLTSALKTMTLAIGIQSKI
jgi:predicted dehydrogenase